MRTAVLILFVFFLIPAAAHTDMDVIGIYGEPDGEYFCADLPYSIPTYLYVVVTNPSSFGISGFNLRVDLPANIIVTEWYTHNGINCLTPPDFDVVFSTPLYGLDAIAVLRLTVLKIDYAIAELDIVPSIVPSIPGYPSYTADDSAGTEIPLLPRFGVNPEFLSTTGPCQSESVFVAADGSGDYPDIQTSLNSCYATNVIALEKGIYTGSGNRDLDYGGKGITVCSRGGSPDSCVIDCQGSPADMHRGARFDSGENSYAELIEVTVRNGWARNGGAVHCRFGSSPTLKGCVFENNIASISGGAVCCEDSSGVWIRDCTLYGNDAPDAGGIALKSVAEADVDNTIIAFSSGGAAVDCASGEASLSCSDLFGNAGGDWVGCVEGQNGAAGNISQDPFFCDPENGDYSLDDSSPCLAENNPACGRIGALGQGCRIRTWHVPSEAPTIQAGIDSASAGDTVLVACGVYHEHDIVMKSGVVLRSETGDYECVSIEADSLGRVLSCVGADSTTRIEGITFMDGYLEDPPYNYGAGIFLEESDVQISDCRIMNNVCESPAFLNCGGGLYLMLGSPRILRCLFLGNTAKGPSIKGGGVYCDGSSAHPRFEECTFLENHGGEGLFLDCCSGTVEDCLFQDHERGALFGEQSITVRRSLFVDNETTFGYGGAISCKKAIIDSCVFIGNRAPLYDGGAIIANDTTLITRCTFTDNEGTQGSAICSYGGSVTADRCIVAFGEGGSAVSCLYGGTIAFSCSDLYGNEGGDWTGCVSGQGTGNGNFSADPMFCRRPEGDLRLRTCSACLDAPGCGLVGALGPGDVTLVWRVPGDAPSIQAALDSSLCGDTILVSSGHYDEWSLQMKSGVRLLGETGDPNDVIIDGNLLGRVLVCIGVDTTTVIEGITLTEGYARDLEGASGGGMLILQCSPRVSRCRFISNRAISEAIGTGYGGGVYGYRSNSVLTDCEFVGNIALDTLIHQGTGGGAFFEGNDYSPRLEGCSFLTNQADLGGGLYLSCEGAVVEECVFEGNVCSGGGGGLKCNASIEVQDCSFIGNTVTEGWGGGMLSSLHPKMQYCVFAENSAGLYGGGGLALMDSAFIETCTFYGNTAAYGSGIACTDNATPWVDRAILSFGRTGAAVYCDAESDILLYCSDVYGNAGGDYVDCLAGKEGINDNFSADPLFCEPESLDLTLKNISPCAYGISPPACGQIGAYGVGCTVTGVVEDGTAPPRTGFLDSPAPNPFNPATTFRFGLPEAGRIRIAIHDVTGRRVAVLAEGRYGAGRHEAVWDGRDASGHAVPSGVYFARMEAEDFTATVKTVLLR
ncbi:MAG: right-handed parallel beta-helix repeat-containing protein [Candidatus Eisenbacteria bacterium]|nr:right-handed parallel beta-helix repeat-containing protein [Candidatus Eisenbacteria bacterium]